MVVQDSVVHPNLLSVLFSPPKLENRPAAEVLFAEQAIRVTTRILCYCLVGDRPLHIVAGVLILHRLRILVLERLFFFDSPSLNKMESNPFGIKLGGRFTRDFRVQTSLGAGDPVYLCIGPGSQSSN